MTSATNIPLYGSQVVHILFEHGNPAPALDKERFAPFILFIFCTLNEYKEVKGVKVPFKTSLNIGIEIELTVSEVKINEGVSDADFQ